MLGFVEISKTTLFVHLYNDLWFETIFISPLNYCNITANAIEVMMSSLPSCSVHHLSLPYLLVVLSLFDIHHAISLTLILFSISSFSITVTTVSTGYEAMLRPNIINPRTIQHIELDLQNLREQPARELFHRQDVCEKRAPLQALCRRRL